MTVHKVMLSGCSSRLSHLDLILAILLFAPSLLWADVPIFQHKPVPEADVAMLPPVCKLILVEIPGLNLASGALYSKYGYLLNRPENQMAKNNPHVHHYCWALLSKLNYFRARTNSERAFWFNRIMTDMDYVLENSPKDWPFFDVILLEEGLMMQLQGDYKGSLRKSEEALRHKPGDEKAYALEFDAYTAMDNQQMAVKIATEGLEKNPDSELLRKRLKKLGVTVAEPSKQTLNERKNISGNSSTAHTPNQNGAIPTPNDQETRSTQLKNGPNTGGRQSSKENAGLQP